MNNRLRNGRVQTEEFDAVQRITPAGLPGSTYVRPMESDGGASNFYQLAKALGGLSSTLGSLADKHEAEAKQKADEETDANFKRDMILAEQDPSLVDKFKNDPAYEGRRHQLALGLVKGGAGVEEFVSSTTQSYINEYNPETDGPVKQWLEVRRNEAMANMTPDEKAGFIQASNGFIENLVSKDLAEFADKEIKTRESGLIVQYQSLVDAGRKANMPPEAIASELVKAGNFVRKGKAVSPEQTDAALLQIAKAEAAKGNSALVAAILRVNRGGKKSLWDDPTTAVDAVGILEAANEVNVKARRENEPKYMANLKVRVAQGQATDDEVMEAKTKGYIDGETAASYMATAENARIQLKEQAETKAVKTKIKVDAEVAEKTAVMVAYDDIVKNGGGDARLDDIEGLPNASDGYADRTMSKEDVRKGVIKMHEDNIALRSKQMAEEQGEDVAYKWALDQHIEFYTKNRWDREQWQGLFNGRAMSGPSALTQKGGELPQDLIAAGQIYKDIRAKNPAMLDGFKMSEDDRLFMEAYTYASTKAQAGGNGAMSETAAWRFASNIAEKKAKGQLQEFSASYDDINSAVDGLDGDSNNDAKDAILDRAKFIYWSNGGDTKAALKEAAELIKRDYIEVNGSLVYSGGQPEDFQPLAEGMIHDLWTRFGNRGENVVEDVENLIMVPNGETGSWNLFERGGAPMLDEKGDPIIIRQSDIDDRRKRLDHNAVLAAQAEAREAIEANKEDMTGQQYGGRRPDYLHNNKVQQKNREIDREYERERMVQDKVDGGDPTFADKFNRARQLDPGMVPSLEGAEERRKKVIEGLDGADGLGGNAGGDRLYDAPTLRKGGGTVNVPKNVVSRKRLAMNFFKDKGLSAEQAAGIVGNLTAESLLDTKAHGDKSIPGGSVGIGQWNRERKQRLIAFARANKRDWRDLDLQLEYVWWELNNHETTAFKMLKNAKTVDQATAAMISYERPAGWTMKNPRKGHNYKGRLRYAVMASQL